jgi:hypothetical protein
MMRYVIIAVTLCGLLSLSACASDWSAWSSIGDDVSLSYTQLTKETWTWKFRNDGSIAITFMTFTYTDANGEHPGVLPGSLKPGVVCRELTAHHCDQGDQARRRLPNARLLRYENITVNISHRCLGMSCCGWIERTCPRPVASTRPIVRSSPQNLVSMGGHR